MVLLLLIIVPLVAVCATLLAKENIKAIERIVIVTAPIELGAVIWAIRAVLHDGSYGIESFFLLDALGAVILLPVVLVGFSATYYSIGYLRMELAKGIIAPPKVKQFFILLHLFLMAMYLAIVTINPIIMWIAIEATTLSTAFLISFYNKPSSMEAAWKYLIINSIGLLLGFFGTLLFLSPTAGSTVEGLVNWHMLMTQISTLDPLVLKIAFIFVLIGYGTKVGLVPLHTWLPDAHSKAPSPISALLSGALLNVALLAVIRFKIVTDASVDVSFTRDLLIIFGLASVIVSAFLIFPQKNYKRLFAYSSIEHMGIIAVGLGFGGIASFGALLHIMYHSLAKSILFFTAGNVLLKYGSTKIPNIRGIISTLPVTGVIIIFGFLAITGIPPFGTFLTELYILSAGIAIHPVVTVVVLLMVALAFVGFLRHVVAMVFGNPLNPTPIGESGLWTVFPPLFMLLLLLLGSILLPEQLRTLIESAALFLQ